MVSALTDCVAQLRAQAARRECSGVLLRSNVPGTFCAGADLKERVGGTQRSMRLIGPARAKLLLFTGRRLNGEQAVAWGLAELLAEDPVQAAIELLEAAAKHAPLALAAAKAAVDEGADLALPEGLAAEREHYSSLFGTHDRMEALRAFAEKRAPVFEGQ
ncbi:hypothetical protein WJX81_005229 [Elliptochloris bilobata]|uniref:Enoyl-CoA hydratase n=1 Tax=Elliptochloris bilobata TaxID=381761 RepID=A0AAW1QMN4_9CHLO